MHSIRIKIYTTINILVNIREIKVNRVKSILDDSIRVLDILLL